jgi:hypothetical protein
MIVGLKPFESSLSKATEAAVSLTIQFRIKSDFSKLARDRCRINLIVTEFDAALSWIRDVGADVAQMAPLTGEDMLDSHWQLRNCASNPVARLLCCAKPIDPFFSMPYETMRIRICLSAELMETM